MKKNIVEKLIILQRGPFYKIAHLLLNIMGLEIPREVKFPADFLGVHFNHKAPGTIFHPKTEIGRNVRIFQQVTIGKQRPWDSTEKEGGCIVKDNAILCAGAKILFGEEQLVVGEGTIIGANAVLTTSTGDNEIWAGIPAKKIGERKNITKDNKERKEQHC